MSEVVETVTKIYVRYFYLDDDDKEIDMKWLHVYEPKTMSGPHSYEVYGEHCGLPNHDWVERYDGDIAKAVSYAPRMAKIVKCGKNLLENGWDWELVMVRDVTRRTVTPITHNAMAVLAVAALD